jgi:hypothetical protein
VLLAPRLMALLNLKTGDSIDVGCHAAYRRGGGAGAGPALTPSRWRRDYDEYRGCGENRSGTAGQPRHLAL